MADTAEKEKKRKFAFWVQESTLDLARQWYRKDNCSSLSEFIEKAIYFYVSYLSSQDTKGYLPNSFLATLKSMIEESDNRLSRLLFKLAVEQAMMSNVLASMQDIDPVTLARLRGECVREVKRLNGGFSFEDAVEWQKD